jgi:hypothetical protein
VDDFSSIIGFIPAEYHSTILAALTVASLALPLLQWIANKTANTWDNALVARIEWVLARVPRIGFGNTQRAQQAVQRTSVKPPPISQTGGMLLSVLVYGVTMASVTLGGYACAGSPTDTALQNRLAANDLREDVNEAAEVLAQAHGALPFICAYLGERSAACMSLQDGYRITASAIDTVHRGIDLLDAVGVGAEQTRVAAERVLSEAKAFGSAVQRTGEEVQNAVAKQADRSGGGPGGPSAEQPAAEASPAEDAGTPAPAAAQ